jgi:hypothetical protein
MGMVLTLRSISDDNTDRLLTEPPLIWWLLMPDMPELYYQAAGIGHKPGLIGKLLGRKAVPLPASPPEFELTEGEGEETDLDKAWAGIHFLLTGSAWEGDAPLNFLTLGGTPVGDIDVGYGPARVIRASEVRVIAEALHLIDESELKARFDPDAMTKADVYPGIWENEGEESLVYCLEYYKELRRFIEAASEASLGLILHLS